VSDADLSTAGSVNASTEEARSCTPACSALAASRSCVCRYRPSTTVTAKPSASNALVARWMVLAQRLIAPPTVPCATVTLRPVVTSARAAYLSAIASSVRRATFREALISSPSGESSAAVNAASQCVRPRQATIGPYAPSGTGNDQLRGREPAVDPENRSCDTETTSADTRAAVSGCSARSIAIWVR
jgi:hypothetical protein